MCLAGGHLDFNFNNCNHEDVRHLMMCACIVECVYIHIYISSYSLYADQLIVDIRQIIQVNAIL